MNTSNSKEVIKYLAGIEKSQIFERLDMTVRAADVNERWLGAIVHAEQNPISQPTTQQSPEGYAATTSNQPNIAQTFYNSQPIVPTSANAIDDIRQQVEAIYQSQTEDIQTNDGAVKGN